MAAVANGFDVDDWLDNYTARVSEARVWRNELLDAHAAAERALAACGDPVESTRLANHLAEIEGEAEATARVLRFKSIGALGWANLIRDHPPTTEQLEDDSQLDHNPLTFPPAATAASSLSPKLTADQAERMRETLEGGEWAKVWQAVLDANLGVLVTFPKSVQGASIRHLLNRGSGATAAPAASRAPSSSNGASATSGRPSNGRPSKTAAARAAGSPATKRSPRKS